jgi:hypothetical protein
MASASLGRTTPKWVSFEKASEIPTQAFLQHTMNKYKLTAIADSKTCRTLKMDIWTFLLHSVP